VREEISREGGWRFFYEQAKRTLAAPEATNRNFALAWCGECLLNFLADFSNFLKLIYSN
jgi:hypothetical protein